MQHRGRLRGAGRRGGGGRRRGYDCSLCVYFVQCWEGKLLLCALMWDSLDKFEKDCLPLTYWFALQWQCQGDPDNSSAFKTQYFHKYTASKSRALPNLPSSTNSSQLWRSFCLGRHYVKANLTRCFHISVAVQLSWQLIDEALTVLVSMSLISGTACTVREAHAAYRWLFLLSCISHKKPS